MTRGLSGFFKCDSIESWRCNWSVIASSRFRRSVIVSLRCSAIESFNWSAIASLHSDRAEAAKSFLARHSSRRVTLGQVAESVGLSPFHLARVFRSHTGMPLHRYLLRLRLRTAMERLTDGADDLTALALDLGFCSHAHFTDAFRREFGHPPSRERNADRVCQCT